MLNSIVSVFTGSAKRSINSGTQCCFLHLSTSCQELKAILHYLSFLTHSDFMNSSRLPNFIIPMRNIWLRNTSITKVNKSKLKRTVLLIWIPLVFFIVRLLLHIKGIIYERSTEGITLNYVSSSVQIHARGKSEKESDPQFVFLMGTEGSGHHLWSSILEKSPNLEQIRSMGLQHALESIIFQLFDKRQLDQSLFAGSACDENWNGTLLVEQTSNKLRKLATQMPVNLTAPLNCLLSTRQISGMISYPNYKSNEKCAGFRHPDVRLLERACNMAKVVCHMIVQHRNPIATIRSTTIRRKLHTLGYAISLYTAMYAALDLQLSTLSSTAVELCWDYDNPKPLKTLGTLLGYKTNDEFETAFRESYVTPPNQPGNVFRIPTHLEIPFESLMAAYKKLLSTCEKINRAV
jgi:hypothetical protein